jgi:hypothetical protein
MSKCMTHLAVAGTVAGVRGSAWVRRGKVARRGRVRAVRRRRDFIGNRMVCSG